VIGICAAFGCGGVAAQQAGAQNRRTLRCDLRGSSDLPQSNSRGEGYENKNRAGAGGDLGRKIEYTYFRSAWVLCATRCERGTRPPSSSSAI